MKFETPTAQYEAAFQSSLQAKKVKLAEVENTNYSFFDKREIHQNLFYNFNLWLNLISRTRSNANQIIINVKQKFPSKQLRVINDAFRRTETTIQFVMQSCTHNETY